MITRSMRTLRSAVVRTRQGNLRATIGNRFRERRGKPRRLLPHASPAVGRFSSRRLNLLLQGLEGETSYLEVGVAGGQTLETICADLRTGVDPAPLFDTTHLPRGLRFFEGSSDEYFASLSPDTTFDLAYVDGLHLYEQAYRDVMNAFRHTSPRGIVVVDDVVPRDDSSALRDYEESRRQRAEAGLSTAWHGDVFIVLAVLRDHHPELAVRVIVGSGNEQAVIWNQEPSRRPRMVSDTVVAGFRDLGFRDVFADGVPTWFNPADEKTVLREASTSTASR